jgi:lysophospholipase L1-like esterase
VLLLGDSTGVGVGAVLPRHTLAGLLADACPQVQVVNRSRNGARVADALAALPALRDALPADGERFDLALLLLGGNDALRGTPRRQLAADAAALLAGLRGIATRTVWLGCPDIGASPLLPPPLSWGMRWRTGRTVALLRGLARAEGVAYHDFFDPPAGDTHARRAGTCFADDGLHPSAAGYRHCFASLVSQGVLPAHWRRRPTHPPQFTRPSGHFTQHPTHPPPEPHDGQRL